MGFFADVTEAQPDPIFGLTAAFNAVTRARKVNLTVGVFKSPQLQTPIMAVVKKAELEVQQQEYTKEYLPIEGRKEYFDAVGGLVFGELFWKENASRISAFQALGGTGALRLGAEFLRRQISDQMAIPQPTWPNHSNIFSKSGMQIVLCPYYDVKRQTIVFDQFYSALSKLANGTVVLLHACCHNPTGADLSLQEWKVLSELFKAKRLIPFFDFAYQGFGTGIDEDAKGVRLFATEGHEMLVSSSFSKNFSLYGERVGTLLIVTGSSKESSHVTSQTKVLIRSDYSNPPMHGAKIATHVLKSPQFKKEWEAELAQMRERIAEMRSSFAKALMSKSKKVNFDFLEERQGLFCYTGLSCDQVEKLRKEYAIYMTSDGRINVTGLNWDNLDYVVDGIITVL